MNPSPDTLIVDNSRRKSLVISILVVVVLWFGLTAAWNTRQVQHRMKCAGNMQKIGLAHKHYVERNGTQPASLDVLIHSSLLAPDDLVCPALGIRNYVQPPNLKPIVGAEGEVIVYEPLGNHKNGAHVLFADGRCQFVPREEFSAVVPAFKSQ